MDDLLIVFRGHGYKITPQRRALVAAMRATRKFFTVQKILELVRAEHPDISQDTIYRNIGILLELGALQEIYGRNRDGNLFEITFANHHHHMICTECGRVGCLDLCPVNNECVDAAADRGFMITSHTFELYGKCRVCRKKN